MKGTGGKTTIEATLTIIGKPIYIPPPPGFVPPFQSTAIVARMQESKGLITKEEADRIVREYRIEKGRRRAAHRMQHGDKNRRR